MKILNSKEIHYVAGGFDGFTALCVLSAVNLLYSFSNSGRINELEENETAVMLMAVYHKAQLKLLPHYNEIQALEPGEVLYRAFS